MLETIRKQNPDWEISIFCRDADTDRYLFEQYGTVAGEVFSHLSEQLNQKDTARVTRYLSWSLLGWPQPDTYAACFIHSCREADALVFCGGGSPGGYGQNNLVRHALVPAFLATRVKCPVIFTGLSLEPLYQWSHRELTRYLLNKSSLITMRDSASIETARALGVKTRIESGADWAVDLTPASPEQVKAILADFRIQNTGGIRIVMNLRDENATGPEGGRRQGDYRKLMLGTVIGLLENPEVRIVVVSMTHSKKTHDDSFAASIRAALPAGLRSRFHVLSASLMPAEIKGIIQTADIFIGTRLHPLIFATSSAVPSIAIHEFSKVRGFMKDCGMEEWFIDYRTTNARQVLNTTRLLITRRDAVARELTALRPTLESGLQRNLDAIRKSLKRGDDPRAVQSTPPP